MRTLKFVAAADPGGARALQTAQDLGERVEAQLAHVAVHAAQAAAPIHLGVGHDVRAFEYAVVHQPGHGYRPPCTRASSSLASADCAAAEM